MKAPCPPPTIPILSFRFQLSMTILSLGEAQHSAVCLGTVACFGEIVERDSGRFDEMLADEGRALSRALLGALHATLPFEYCPAVEPDVGQEREDTFEVDLAVAERAEAPGALIPWLVAAVDADAAARSELGVLDVKATDPLAVQFDECAVVELLQEEMARIVVDTGGGMLVCMVEERLEGGAVIDVRTGMEFVTDDAATVARIVEERPPATGEFLEGFVDQTRRPLRPRIDHVPGKSARKHGNVAQAELSGCIDALAHFARRPLRPLGAPKPWRMKARKTRVIGGMDCQHLAREIRRYFGN